ncbi:TIGR04168 family protein [Pseudanabaena sp. FACHB-1998]|uniref:TIGR04168 family protein n=1 Tax=Pseudanabaena sp. FACHB-1998 TaxID=2692858 RepID=UPI0016801242|nr:TIGR04168 family protein [Pseudanabaena sp. FACHB-1998]MBD2178757.1 TIGR04168 family protein [Pseudanabaena sp. FACHB-1998]
MSQSSSASPVKSSIKIAVIGDVHDLWQPIEDRQALHSLGADLVLFVGDFGNEAIEIVKAIADLDLPKAAILGNHDAWYSATDPYSKTPPKHQCPYDRTKEDRVQQQLDLLGKCHVGYSWLDFPEFNLSVVGARPFSWGGSKWKKKFFYRDRFNINSFAESTQRIKQAIASTDHETIIFLGHNGPAGLGTEEYSICGKDWKPIGGDYGDPDFAEAIAYSYQLSKTVPLVTFGHMHHHLRHTSSRNRDAIATNAMGTFFVNSALTPRIIQTHSGFHRNFSLVNLEHGQVTQISIVWLNQSHQIVHESILFKTCKLFA